MHGGYNGEDDGDRGTQSSNLCDLTPTLTPCKTLVPPPRPTAGSWHLGQPSCLAENVVKGWDSHMDRMGQDGGGGQDVPLVVSDGITTSRAPFPTPPTMPTQSTPPTPICVQPKSESIALHRGMVLGHTLQHIKSVWKKEWKGCGTGCERRHRPPIPPSPAPAPHSQSPLPPAGL